MDLFSKLLFPLALIGTPIWLGFLFYLLKKRVNQESVWGFLMAPSESSTSPQNKFSWPWIKLLLFFIAGFLCFIVLTFPFHNTLNIFIDEPQLLKTLNQQQQTDYLKRLKKHINATTQLVHFESPEGSLTLTKDSLPNLFQHSFDSAISLNSIPSKEYDLYTGHSFKHENQLPFIAAVHHNTHGIYGLYKDQGKLHLAIWANFNIKEINLHYNNKVIPIKLNKWSFIELPSDALHHQLHLEPFDDYAIDNYISMKNYQPQPFTWSSKYKLSTDSKTYLNDLALWRNHPPLLIHKNKIDSFSNGKHLNFINQPLLDMCQVSQIQSAKSLYSTAYLSLSSRHHSLEWAISKPPTLSLTHKNYLPLWFQENEVYANINLPKTILNTSLNFSDFSYGLNQKAFELSILTLYPELEDPWLIKRNQLNFHSYETIQPTKPNEFYSIGMAFCLLSSSLLVLLSLRKINDR